MAIKMHETYRVRRNRRSGWDVEQYADGFGWFRVAWFMVESDADKWARDH